MNAHQSRRSQDQSNNNENLTELFPLRLKCIVLGSAGAGKTSFLRRFFTGKFEYGHRRSTIGADFYPALLPNPWFNDNQSQQTREFNRDDRSRKSKESTITKTHKKKKKKSKKKREKRSKQIIEGHDSGNHNEETDSASIASTAISKATNCTKISNKNRNETNNKIHRTKQIALQMWDTAGKERFGSQSKGFTSRLGDSFFRHADVAILIYDATSSTSFLQLIQGYSELLDRIDKIHSKKYNAYYDDNRPDDSSRNNDGFGSNDWNQKQPSIPSNLRNRFPVLIVATKLDRLKAELSKQAREKNVPQRSVLGLKGKYYNGQDYHYEYTVSNAYNHHRQVDGKDGFLAQERNFNENHIPLSYGMEGGAWTNDKEYLNCLRTAEDACFPDNYMVLLWCKRNGLKHVGVSALDGMGINEAVDTMIDLTLSSINEQIMENSTITDRALLYQLDESDDFQSRYKSNGDSCSFCRRICPKTEF